MPLCLSSAAGPWKLFRDQAERHSGIGLKPFGFIAESVFTITRNPVRVHPGTAFGIIPEWRSASIGFLNSLDDETEAKGQTA